MADKERAKKLVLEILHQAGGSLGKALLFKIFWLSHLYYSKKARGYLTDWPIVRMPNGPSLDKGDLLIRELASEGYLSQEHEPNGPYVEIHCKLTEKALKESSLSKEAVESIQEAVEFAKKHSPASISQWSHEFSRSWNNTPNGEELDIYTDLIPDDVYAERQEQIIALKKAYEGLFE